MTVAAAPLAGRIASIDPAVAERQTRLLAALNERLLDGGTLRAAVERDAAPAPAGWIRLRCGDGSDGASVHLRPLLVDGGLPPVGLDDAATAAVLLGRVEPIVAALEAALATPLFPSAVAATPAPGALVLRLALRDGDATRHELLAAIPPGGPVAAPALPAAPSAIARTWRRRWRASLAGPSLTPARIGSIVAGDMLLLGVRPLLAQMDAGTGRTRGVRIDMTGGVMTVLDDHESATAPPAARAFDAEAVRVPTTIEIEGPAIAIDQAARLAPGSVLPLPAGGGTLAVTVRAGDNLLGTGELVAVGEGFGVLFTGIAADAGA